MFETSQLSLFPQIKSLKPELNLLSYDHYIVGFSGGKDSIASFLYLLERGVPKENIELWHHKIDGEGNGYFMDWPVTTDYCKKFAQAFSVPIYFSWKEGGFKREMLRNNEPTAPTLFEALTDDGDVECGLAGGHGNVGTRLKFPQVSANLSVRWCSSYLKIDPCAKSLNNQSRFLNKRTLVITGERAEESKARAKYKTFESHRTDRRAGKRVKRHVDHLRPVHGWSEAEIWAIIEKYRVNAHPAYHLGWGRLSCMKCIFGSNNQWASANKIHPAGVQEIASYEADFQTTIHRSLSVPERIQLGTPYQTITPELSKASMETVYDGEIITNDWILPSGAFGENVGPV